MIKRHALLALAFLAAHISRAEFTHVFDTEPAGRIEIRASTPYESPPPVGFLPWRVTIDNASAADGVWQFSFQSRRHYGQGTVEDSGAVLAAKAGGTTRFDVLAPLVPRPRDEYASVPQRGAIRGPGVRAPEFLIMQRGSGSSHTAFIGMTPDLATPSWTSLEKRIEADRMELAGCAVDAGALGADWRAWVGMDALWITTAEYDALPPDARRGMRDWLLQGGVAFLCVAPGDTMPQELRPPGGESFRNVGLGQIRVFEWDPVAAPLDAAAKAIKDQPRGLGDLLAHLSPASMELVARAGELKMNAGLLSFFVVAFAVTVGPLNILWFAGAGRRHRLFWTTPLISIVASALLAMGIVLQDGFGGSGGRVLLHFLAPDEPRALVIQEQAARTGLLLGRGFDLDDGAMICPVVTGMEGSRERTLRVNGERYDGDWFTSRSIQAQTIQAIVPTRESVELVNAAAVERGEAPEILSSIAAELKSLHFVDSDGVVWKGEGVKAGERRTLVRDTAGDMASSISRAVRPGPVVERAIERVKDRRGFFYAVSDDGPFVETLRSIAWSGDVAVHIGEVKSSAP